MRTYNILLGELYKGYKNTTLRNFIITFPFIINLIIFILVSQKPYEKYIREVTLFVNDPDPWNYYFRTSVGLLPYYLSIIFTFICFQFWNSENKGRGWINILLLEKSIIKASLIKLTTIVIFSLSFFLIFAIFYSFFLFLTVNFKTEFQFENFSPQHLLYTKIFIKIFYASLPLIIVHYLIIFNFKNVLFSWLISIISPLVILASWIKYSPFNLSNLVLINYYQAREKIVIRKEDINATVISNFDFISGITTFYTLIFIVACYFLYKNKYYKAFLLRT